MNEFSKFIFVIDDAIDHSISELSNQQGIGDINQTQRSQV